MKTLRALCIGKLVKHLIQKRFLNAGSWCVGEFFSGTEDWKTANNFINKYIQRLGGRDDQGLMKDTDPMFGDVFASSRFLLRQLFLSFCALTCLINYKASCCMLAVPSSKI